MRFSLFYNFDVTPEKDVPELYRDVEVQAIVADRMGFDAVWLAEHHFTVYGRLPSPLTYLTWIGARTSQIGLGTAVVEAPYYNPLRLAEDAALLDVLSNGRVRLGVGSGARNKTEEFVKFGLPLEQKSARTLEVLEVLHQGLDRPSISFDGSWYAYDGVEINPRPRQKARDLIWVAASQTTVEIAGDRGHSLLIPRVGNAGAHQDLIRRYRAAANGRPSFVSMLRFVYVAETEAQAYAQTHRTFERYAKYDCGVDWDGRTDSAEYADLSERMHFVIGTPEQVTQRLIEWERDYGFDEIMCQLYAAGMEHADSLRSLELLAAEVMPKLITAGPGPGVGAPGPLAGSAV